MWFRQAHFFELKPPIPLQVSAFAEKLSALEFVPCLPSMASSSGFVSPIEENDEPLARSLNQCILFCLQVEEKILPASVVNQALKEKIHQIEMNEARKVWQKEKYALKDEIIFTLLPRAFSKYTRILAYIDTKAKWLVINTTNPAKTELFLAMFKKIISSEVVSFTITKPSSIFTQWVKSKEFPKEFAIEKACVLQDPKQQNRIIRCHQQDLFAGGIQSLLKDGCDVMQIALSWHDKINFVIGEDFTLRNIKLVDETLTSVTEEQESAQQKFASDFLVMTEMFSGVFKDLLTVFSKQTNVALAKAV